MDATAIATAAIPVEITAERWREMLEILPPLGWYTERGAETFTVPEGVDDLPDGRTLYNRFLRLNGEYWTMLAPLTLSVTAMVNLVAGVKADRLAAAPIVRSIVPAFFVIDIPAEGADEVAAEACSSLNDNMRKQQAANPGMPRFRLLLCEASPTTEQGIEQPWEDTPHTLEGLTCDSGSDRSATALIQRIVGATYSGGSSDANALSSIAQMAQAWLQQRMASHPNASTAAAPCAERALSSAELLIHAYARGQAEKGISAPTWCNLEKALAQAKAENPGLFEVVLAGYLTKEQAHA